MEAAEVEICVSHLSILTLSLISRPIHPISVLNCGLYCSGSLPPALHGTATLRKHHISYSPLIALLVFLTESLLHLITQSTYLIGNLPSLTYLWFLWFI